MGDKSLNSILFLFKYQGINADKSQIIHKFALETYTLDNSKIIRIAKNYGFKCKNIKNYKGNLENLILPCLVKSIDGSWFILGKISSTEALLFNFEENKTSKITLDEFNQIWTKNVIILKHKEMEHRDVIFSFKWFIPTILKYKKTLIEVLIVALSAQIPQLFTPIMMQVVIDKVLVHNSLSTLNVLVGGLIAIAFFEFLLGIARNYVFTSTTNKIDVILGAKLFEHLIHLPLPYFESRRVGDTVARVRELKNIGHFLIGTPLSSMIDLMFMIVYSNLKMGIYYSFILPNFLTRENE